MHQIPFSFLERNTTNLLYPRLSHDGTCSDKHRLALEQRYDSIIHETNFFNRQLVSYQANKTTILHSWIKYREGFSSTLVELLLKQFGLETGNTVLDPFAGSATTLLVAKMLGINAVGIELLPHCHLAWQAKSRVFNYDLDEISNVYDLISKQDPPRSEYSFPHLKITESAFSESVEKELMAYSKWFEDLDVREDTRILCKLVLMGVLESVSYTRKDGQYLRWDARAGKIRQRNQLRVARNQKPIKGINKGELPTVKQAILQRVAKIKSDIRVLQKESQVIGSQTLIEGDTLQTLPAMQENQFDAIITSPPYANRYDYTRTYALELAYLGVNNQIFDLRQNQLSCTVENKSKLSDLKAFYSSIHEPERFERLARLLQESAVLQEVDTAIRTREKLGEINNKGICPMIRQYFEELTFVFSELYRVCRRGAYVAIVNDNVRYAGEIIAVDTISTDLAEKIGFEPIHIYVLPQRKGNSSQQMGKYGRVALRKSITIWRKP